VYKGFAAPADRFQQVMSTISAMVSTAVREMGNGSTMGLVPKTEVAPPSANSESFRQSAQNQCIVPKLTEILCESPPFAPPFAPFHGSMGTAAGTLLALEPFRPLLPITPWLIAGRRFHFC
jgi:hypothetical protein